MKKNFIYTVTFLLCGAIFFGSCEDMLEPDSSSVEYNYDGWTFNDSVYSVLGIMKSVQKIGDRQVLLGELRGDLLSVTDKVTDDVRAISEFNFDAENNPYLAAKDYYSIINNCNVFLARVDTTLEYDNRRLMLSEYVAVKSFRAWTYLQLIKNHAYIPFFTDPVLTHSKAEEVMSATPADHLTVIDALIKDIAPYENPKAYGTPGWGSKVNFMPVRVLLGDLYLWRAAIKAETASYPLPAPNPQSDYAMAANCYYKFLTEDQATLIPDNAFVVSHRNADPDEDMSFPDYAGYKEVYQTTDVSKFFQIDFAGNDNDGLISHLDEVFLPNDGEAGTHQVTVSPSLKGLSERQTYVFEKENNNKKTYTVVDSKYYPGDLRLLSTTAEMLGTGLDNTRYEGVITKINGTSSQSGNSLMTMSGINVTTIAVDRIENVYLRFAEAMLGLEREGYTGAKELAMAVLKSGVKERYEIYWQPDTVVCALRTATGDYYTQNLLDGSNKQVVITKEIEKLDEEGNVVLDEEGNVVVETISYPQVAPVLVDSVKSAYSPMVFNFSQAGFQDNIGIHSRGSGATIGNEYYALTDSCVAQYFGIPANGKTTVREYVYNEDNSYRLYPKKDETSGEYIYLDDEKTVVAYDTKFKETEIDAYNVTEDDRVAYMYDKVIDEMALEMAWEGHRFSDLIRFATELGNPDFLAKRVAARGVQSADWRSAEGADGWNPALYQHLTNKNNWYLPLPDNYFIPNLTGTEAANQ